jgi:hypothetical protein
VNNESLRASTWGETADPDRDGFVNLQEYAFGTVPTTRDTIQPVTWSTTVAPGHFALTYKARTGDPALLILPQASAGLSFWNPPAPSAVSAWAGDPLRTFMEISRSAPTGNYVTVTQAATATLSGMPSQFTRVLVMRGAISAVTSPTDGLRFQEQIASGAGQTVESNTITPSGFTGTILISTTGGARLIVNGVDVGTSTEVSAGSEVRLRGTSPATSSGSYGVVIYGTASTWTITTRPPVQPEPVAGTVSGYTTVSASVGENGAANINIPITVPPGTAGMEPKLAITYSSQAPNGLLGVGFSISGLSANSRSGPTKWHDGKRGGVSLTENSATNESAGRFALDGQRLQITSGTWGAPGSTYRTEIDTFPASPPSAIPMPTRSHGAWKPKPASPMNTAPPPTPAPSPAAPASPATMPCSPLVKPKPQLGTAPQLVNLRTSFPNGPPHLPAHSFRLPRLRPPRGRFCPKWKNQAFRQYEYLRLARHRHLLLGTWAGEGT